MKFFCVCTKPLYGPEHVYSLHKQLRVFYSGAVEMYVYTDRPELFDNTLNVIAINHNICERQWYKMDFMGPMNDHLDEPIIVMDIDMNIISCVDDLVDIPTDRHDFYAIDRWWRPSHDNLPINGGMYKYYPNTCRSIYDEFYKNPSMWQSKYKSPSSGPVHGEQSCVWELLRATHVIKTFPGQSIIRYRKDVPDTMEIYGNRYCKTFNLPYMISGGQYHPSISIIHG